MIVDTWRLGHEVPEEVVPGGKQEQPQTWRWTWSSLPTVPVGQWSLSLHQLEHGSKVTRELDASDAVPAHPQNTGKDRVYWDFEAAFVDEDTIVAGTSECDGQYGSVRHWLVDVKGMDLLGEISYPVPVSGPARAAGGGRWYTISKDGTTVRLWELAQVN
ncbi:hypothetical protein ACWGQ5_54035 [Streptomyces sp. NPDC055722]